jgi:hypothetical protein
MESIVHFGSCTVLSRTNNMKFGRCLRIADSVGWIYAWEDSIIKATTIFAITFNVHALQTSLFCCSSDHCVCGSHFSLTTCKRVLTHTQGLIFLPVCPLSHPTNFKLSVITLCTFFQLVRWVFGAWRSCLFYIYTMHFWMSIFLPFTVNNIHLLAGWNVSLNSLEDTHIFITKPVSL